MECPPCPCVPSLLQFGILQKKCEKHFSKLSWISSYLTSGETGEYLGRKGVPRICRAAEVRVGQIWSCTGCIFDGFGVHGFTSAGGTLIKEGTIRTDKVK